MSITVIAAAPAEVDAATGTVAPRIPDGWRREREGTTGWWSLYAPAGAPGVGTRICLYDLGIGAGMLRIYQATVQSRDALRLLGGLLSAVPWWSTVSELRAYRGTGTLPAGRDATWGTQSTQVLAAWRDERQAGDGSDPVRVYRTLMGVSARGDAEAATREDIEAAIVAARMR